VAVVATAAIQVQEKLLELPILVAAVAARRMAILAWQAALALSSYATQHLISLSLCSTLLPSGLLLSA
jgi:hypothetical protein